MAAELWSLAEIDRYLNVSDERARQVAADDPTFRAPATQKPRRWSRATIERWTERGGGERDDGDSVRFADPFRRSQRRAKSTISTRAAATMRTTYAQSGIGAQLLSTSFIEPGHGGSSS
jgi:hypothetical protein